jgi:hemolysin III
MERPPREERLNALTHGGATLMATIASSWLIFRAIQFGRLDLTIAASIYGTTLVGVFLFSTLSHSESNSDRRTIFRRLDQGFIYLLIIGTMTPFLLAYFAGARSYWILVISWAVAIVGFGSKVFFAHRVNRVSVVSYIALGWIPPLAVLPVDLNEVPLGPLVAIVLGGFLYTLGTYFLYFDRKAWYYHSIWHLFVLAAASVHYLAVLHLFNGSL